MVPAFPEVAAAWQLSYGRYSGINFWDRGPDGAERPGALGPARTLQLAYELGDPDLDVRTRALDTMLGLAAAGRLSGRGLGEDLGALVAHRQAVLAHVFPLLADAARGGARILTWEVVAGMLRALAGAPVGTWKALPDLLALGARLVTELGRRDDVPGLVELAGRGGVTRTVTEAQRLHQALRAPA